MLANGHTPSMGKNNKSAAVVEVNTLSEDNQSINPADHDGIISENLLFFS